MDIPPQYQLLSALLIGILVAIGAAYRFFADLKRPPEPVEHEHLRILGAALGDSASLGEITAELREIRGVMQRHLDTDRTDELIKAIDRMADTLGRREPSRQRWRSE